MNKIEQMVKEMCPGGVRCVKLETLLDYKQPTPYIVKSTEYCDTYPIPVLTAGQTFVLGFTNETFGIFKASKNNPTIIFDDFTTSFHWVDFDFKVKSSAMKMLTPKTNNSFRYIYYAMSCRGFVPTEHSRHWISKYSQFEIPLPPLPIQEAIVEILGKFESLQQGLQDELQARKKQYEYYRNKLLTQFPDNVQVKEYSLGEICEFRNGYTPSKSHPEFWDGGDIPWFRMEDIRLNGRILSDSIQHITAKGVKGKGLFKANTFILATTATIGEHAMIIADSLANQRFTNLKIRESLEGEICKKYFYYYMYLVDDFCKKHINVSGFASVDMDALKKMKIQIPTSEYQVKVIDFLDKEEGLLSQLGNEISLRKAQYDYYRNMMLSFK